MKGTQRKWSKRQRSQAVAICCQKTEPKLKPNTRKRGMVYRGTVFAHNHRSGVNGVLEGGGGSVSYVGMGMEEMKMMKMIVAVGVSCAAEAYC